MAANGSSGEPTDAVAMLPDDANWMMTAAFIIFTMQTGFGMLESGCVSTKNEVNIMMKNVVDIFLGGLSYWVVGYGLSFGKTWTCPVLAVGHLALDTDQLTDNAMGSHFTSFLFQLSFATTATTIVSGAMAERCNFGAYCLFSLLNTVIYCVPAGWVWGDHGFLYAMGVIDIAGSGPVHLIGGVSAFASALMLGPRLGRYGPKGEQTLGTPVNCAMGLFVLWWGWLAFNSGSTYGVTGAKWQYAAKAAVMTMLSSFGGGVVGLVYTLVANSGRTDIMDMINSVLGALVAVTAGCFLYTGWEALLIGSVGGVLTCLSGRLVDGWLGVDDPVGASSVHLVCGLWGVLAVGLFAGSSPLLPHARGTGVFKGGTGHLLAVQAIACVCLALYSLVTTLLILWVIDKITPLRMSPRDELLGADYAEHMISVRTPSSALSDCGYELYCDYPQSLSLKLASKLRNMSYQKQEAGDDENRHTSVGVSRAESAALSSLLEAGRSGHKIWTRPHNMRTIGVNRGHEIYLEDAIKKHLEELEVAGQTTHRLESILMGLEQAGEPPATLAWIE